MKIAFLLPSLDAKGPEIFTDNLIRGLLDEGCLCEVFYFNESVISPLSFPVKCTKLCFWRLYDFHDFDIVHTTMAKPDIYMALYGRQIKAKWVSGIHCFMKEDLLQLRGRVKATLYGWLWTNALKKAKNIIVSSIPMQRYYKNMLKEHDVNWKVIPYGIPAKEIVEIDDRTKRLLLDIKAKYTVLAGCGLLIKRKGFYQMINYLQHNEKAAVVLIGDGECRQELVAQAKSLNVSERLFFLGMRPNSINYYPFFDIYCMCSNSEGFGLAMLEAMFLGLPVVCSELDIYKEYFSKDDVSFFRYANQDSFNKAVDVAIANKEHYKNCSLKLYNEKFSLKTMAVKHKELYVELLKTSK